MNATNIEAYAVGKGLDFVWSKASQAEKAEVAMQMFFENTEQYAGNFAMESTETVTGAIGLLQAALGSFTGGLGNANADMTNLTENLVDAFQAVVTNIVPVIQNLAASLPDAFATVAGALGDLLPSLLHVATDVFRQVLDVILRLLPELIPVAVEAIMTIVDALIDNLPMLIDAALALVVSLADGLVEALPELIPATIDAVITIVESLIDNIDMLIDAAIAIIVALSDGLIDALPMLIDKMPEIIIKIAQALADNLPKIIEAGIGIILALAGALIKSAPQLYKKIPEIMRGILGAIGSYYSKIFEVGKNIVKGIWEGIKAMGKWIADKVKGFFKGIVSGVKTLLGIRSPSKVFAEIGKDMSLGVAKGIEDSEDEAIKAAKKMAEDTFEFSKSWIDTRKKYNELTLADELLAWERVKNRYIEGSRQKEEAEYQYYRVKKEITDKTIELENKYSDAVSKRTSEIIRSYGLFDELKEREKVSGRGLLKNLEAQTAELQAWTDSLAELAQRGIDEGLLNEIQSMGPDYREEIRGLLSLSDEDLAKYENLFAEKQKIANERAIVELESLRDETDNQISRLLTGVEKQFDETPDIGRDAMTGLAEGISSGMSGVITAAVSVAQGAVEAVKDALGIASPSKVFAGIGKNMAAGLGKGFSAEMRGVARQINDSVPTSFESPTISATSRIMEGAVNGMAALAGAQQGGVFNINVVLPDGHALASVVFEPLKGIIRQKGASFA